MRNNCGLVALSALTDVDLGAVTDAFRRPGRWSGRTNLRDRLDWLERQGCAVDRVAHSRACVRKVCAVLPAGRYMLRTGGHALALVDGLLTDQTGTYAPDHPDVARRIVTDIHQVRI